MEEVQETVVEASVDAEQETNGVIEESTTDTDQKVVEETVDSSESDKNVGEAIKKEVERREAQLKAKYEQENKTLAQQARDNYIAEQNYQWNGKPIKTEAEYKEALKEQELRDKYSDLPEEVQQELIESKKFRENYTKQQEESTKQAKQQEDYKQFLETFPDTKPEDIPKSVWDEVNKGKSLVDAFTRHENQSLKEQIKSLTEKKEIEQKNEENANSSTGSVTGQGNAKATRFTREQVAEMSRDEVQRNWDAINKSMKTWE
jgi:hypothetical protein